MQPTIQFKIFHLLFKNLKTGIYRTKMLPVPLHGMNLGLTLCTKNMGWDVLGAKIFKTEEVNKHSENYIMKSYIICTLNLKL